MSIIEWQDEQFLLGVDIMDDTHREFIDLVNRLNQASDVDFPALFDALIDHTQAHFEMEEKLMRDTGFTSYAEHREDHQRVLGELNQFRKRVQKGLLAFGRNYIRERMPSWFPLHASIMDSALAMHLKNLPADQRQALG
jgi:hemerythrin-like metal-binding protein